MQKVFVLDSVKQPLAPCHPARARELLAKGKAAVYRRYPFTIILKDRTGGDVQPIQIKFDPGSKTTGIALVQENKNGLQGIFGAELTHKGQSIVESLQKRLALRRGRRQRHTRYRAPRQLNRANAKQEGRLMPSIRSRIDNQLTWFTRLYKFAPITGISMELVRFDTQIMQNPEISGVEYQQGTLAGYELREYLLEKWGRKCAYCGKKDVPLQIEHIHPKSKGGSDRVANLTLACEGCNLKKGNQPLGEFLKDNPDLAKKILAQAKAPLKDAAAVNSARWALWRQFKETGLPLETGSGGRTKFNRVTQGYEKAHWIDAACVGKSGERVYIPATIKNIAIRAKGRGGRQMQRVNGYGFPCATPREHVKRRGGFQTGDIVRVTKFGGKPFVARISETNKTGFAVKSMANPSVKKTNVAKRDTMTIVQRSDGYSYEM